MAKTPTLDEIIAAEVAAGNVSHLSFSPLVSGQFQASYRTVDDIRYRIAVDKDPVKAIRDALLGTGSAASKSPTPRSRRLPDNDDDLLG